MAQGVRNPVERGNNTIKQKLLIRYLLHNDIDKTKWDVCIRKAFNGNIYAVSWYLDVVHKNWEALVEDDYVRVMPLTGNKKYGIHYLFQPFFAQQLGVFSTEILNSSVINDFIVAIPQKYRFVQINLNIHNHPQPGGYRLIANKDYLLDLISKYPKLSLHYTTNTKRNLKKALSSRLTLVKGMEPGLLTDMFRQNKGREIKHWHDEHYFRLKQLMFKVLFKGGGEIYGVYTEHNELCAGAFFLKDHQHLIFLFSATTPEARQNGAMTFLLDAVIREYAETALVLDFEGSNNQNLAHFYRGFGAQEITYYRLEINRLSFPFNRIVQALAGK